MSSRKYLSANPASGLGTNNISLTLTPTDIKNYLYLNNGVSPKRKDSAFEDDSTPTPKMHGYLSLAMSESKSFLMKKGYKLAKKKWCSIDSDGLYFSVYASLTSQLDDGPPILHLFLSDFKVSPCLLDGGNIVAFYLKSKTTDTCLIAFQSLRQKEVVEWVKSFTECASKFELHDD